MSSITSSKPIELNVSDQSPVVDNSQTTEEKIVNNKSIGSTLKGLTLKVAKFVGRLIAAIALIIASPIGLPLCAASKSVRNAYSVIFLGRPLKQEVKFTNYKDELVARHEKILANLKHVSPIEQEIVRVRANLKRVNKPDEKIVHEQYFDAIHHELISNPPTLNKVVNQKTQDNFEDKTTRIERVDSAAGEIIEEASEHKALLAAALFTGIAISSGVFAILKR